MRRAVPLVLVVACGHGGGMPDEDLGGLVISPKEAPEAIDVDRATKDPAELGRALALRERDVIAAIGMHVLATNSDVSVTEGGKVVSDLGDHATLELGKAGYHATYTNSADYGREIIFADGELYLRPRY